MVPFRSKHCFCSMKQVVLQNFQIFPALIHPLQTASWPKVCQLTPLGPADTQSITDVELEIFSANYFRLSFSLVFLETLVILPSSDSEK